MLPPSNAARKTSFALVMSQSTSTKSGPLYSLAEGLSHLLQWTRHDLHQLLQLLLMCVIQFGHNKCIPHDNLFGHHLQAEQAWPNWPHQHQPPTWVVHLLPPAIADMNSATWGSLFLLAYKMTITNEHMFWFIYESYQF